MAVIVWEGRVKPGSLSLFPLYLFISLSENIFNMVSGLPHPVNHLLSHLHKRMSWWTYLSSGFAASRFPANLASAPFKINFGWWTAARLPSRCWKSHLPSLFSLLRRPKDSRPRGVQRRGQLQYLPAGPLIRHAVPGRQGRHTGRGHQQTGPSAAEGRKVVWHFLIPAS